MTINRGFTLIEILIAVMLSGLLAGLALAPVAVTVRRTVDVQTQYAEMTALSRTIDFIARDIYAAMRLAPDVVTVKDHEAMGGKADDILLVMSTSPSMQGKSSGTIVYRIAEGGILHGNVIPGLYRWIFPGISPSEVKTDTLNAEQAQLVLPYADEFSVEVPSGMEEDDRRKEYTGQLPEGIYIKITRGEKEDGTKNEAEQVITFP